MTEPLLNRIGQSLVAIGLYTVAFESLALTCREQMQGYLMHADQALIPAFTKACSTANNTILFCEQQLCSNGILDQRDLDSLTRVRKRHNAMAHAGYNHMLYLTIKDVKDDVELMFILARKIEIWCHSHNLIYPNGNAGFSLAPSIFGLYLEAANALATTKLRIADFAQGGT
jgi:hypothetical protein